MSENRGLRMLGDVLADLWAVTFMAAPVFWVLFLVVLPSMITASSCEFFERRGLRGTLWAMASVACVAGLLAVSQAEVSSTSLGVGPR